MNYKQVLKEKNQGIRDIRQAIVTNKIIVRDSSEILAALKAKIRDANKAGGGALVGTLTKELNVRRSLVRQVTDVQVTNRTLLREAYLLRKAIIEEWVAKES